MAHRIQEIERDVILQVQKRVSFITGSSGSLVPADVAIYLWWMTGETQSKVNGIMRTEENTVERF